MDRELGAPPLAGVDTSTTTRSGSRFLCGPLLRYTYIDYAKPGKDDHDLWHGTLLVVVEGSAEPTMHVETDTYSSQPTTTLLLDEHGRKFWRFNLLFYLGHQDEKVRYTISLPAASSTGTPSSESTSETKHGLEETRQGAFWLPAKGESMRIMFYSCNGFSADIKPDTFAGPTLWKDVMRVHTDKRPFHVMIGGGDQIYSDEVETLGPLKHWGSMSVRRRAKQIVDKALAKSLDEWYFGNYCRAYTIPEFAESAASIPSVQIFDDHDIIDGYGSYKEKTMKSPYYVEIGKVAWKYYMLFQQHTPPSGEPEGDENPSWVIGKQPGPYIQERSRSICTTFGKRVAFYGLDCRVERTIDRVCFDESYDLMFARLRERLVKGETKHLLLLLGVPIAYPRLKWLETLLSRYTDTPVRLFNRLLGVGEKYFNKFDGSAELLDDLNDHWCAGTHKDERNRFIERLQEFAKEFEIRITILSGDVHLPCVGRFFSTRKIPQNKDHRYMVNIISSAITNAPPPKFVANFLNRRNKIHRLKEHTSENLMKLFDVRPTGKTKGKNRTTMPARNYCIITEHAGLSNEAGLTKPVEGDSASPADAGDMSWGFEMGGSSTDPSASAPKEGTKRKYALDVCIRAEVDPHSTGGETKAYGFPIPALDI